MSKMGTSSTRGKIRRPGRSRGATLAGGRKTRAATPSHAGDNLCILGRMWRRTASPLVALALLNAACGKTDPPTTDTTAPRADTTAAAAPSAAPSAASGAGAAPAASTGAGGGTVSVSGRLRSGSVSNFDTVINGAKPALRTCYEQGLAAEPKMAGLATFEVAIATDGTVTNATEKSATGVSGAVRECCIGALSKLKFEAPAPAGTATGTMVMRFAVKGVAGPTN